MNWTVVICCVVGFWGMLTAFGGERKRQINEIQARKEAEAAEAAASKSSH